MRRIIKTYTIVSPESAAIGGIVDCGFAEEGGWKYSTQNRTAQYIAEAALRLIPVWSEDLELEEGETIASVVAEFLQECGAVHPSGTSWYPDLWYSTEPTVEDYRTAEYTEYSYHLDGFTDVEGQAIFMLMQGK